MDDLDVLIQTDNVLTVFARGIQAGLLTPEQRAEVRAKLHELIEPNLRDDLFIRPFTDQDPVFHWTDLDKESRRIYIRWDGVFVVISGDRAVRVADPFDLNVIFRHSNTVQRWTAGSRQVSIESLQLAPSPYGDGTDDIVAMRITTLRTPDPESSQDLSEVHYVQFSWVNLLVKLEEVLPTIGRLVLTKVEPDKFNLAVQYHHNPRRRRQIPGGLIQQDEDVYVAVARLHGDILAVEMLDESQIT